MRVLVIGGTLFIGRAMVEKLLARGDEVAIMHRGQGTPWGDRVREIRCDRNDVNAVRAAFSGEAFDEIYDNVYDWQRGTSAGQVVAAARAASHPGLRRYVFTSSVAVYGDGLDHREGDPLVPADFPNKYGAEKAESERALFQLQRTEGVPVTTVRPSFVYGPNNPFRREAWFWDRIMADRPVIVPGDGSRPQQYVHAAEVAEVALRAAARPESAGSSYSLGNYPPISQREFVETLARVAGRAARVVLVPREKIAAEGGVMMGDPLYFGEFLDPPPITVQGETLKPDLGITLGSLEDGFRSTFDWYRRQSRPRPDFTWEDQVLGGSAEGRIGG
jgi:nucleoside-diphosphate-sugar epimerase